MGGEIGVQADQRGLAEGVPDLLGRKKTGNPVLEGCGEGWGKEESLIFKQESGPEYWGVGYPRSPEKYQAERGDQTFLLKLERLMTSWEARG